MNNKKTLFIYNQFLLITLSLILSVNTGYAIMDDSSIDLHCRKRCQNGCEVPSFDRNQFSNPTLINNKWLPFIPGTRFILEGHVIDEKGKKHDHRQILTVTDLGKEINGVLTLVLLDQDFSDNELIEEELTFVAQDNKGQVWNFGEYPEEYENGKFVGAPSTWIAGLQKAKPGIHMLAKPQANRSSYAQGKAIKVEFFDCARVVKTHKKEVCVPAGCFTNVLVIDEWDPLEPEGGRQRKYYAPGLGLIKVKAIREDEPENLKLVEFVQLNAAQMEEVRDKALLLDQRAYFVVPLYRHTQPAKPL